MNNLLDELYLSLCALADIAIRKWRKYSRMVQAVLSCTTWHDRYNMALLMWGMARLSTPKLEQVINIMEHIVARDEVERRRGK
jgi:hypothetical protein